MLLKIHRELGIASSYSNDSGVPIYTEPNDLVSIGLDVFDRPQSLASKTAGKWHDMRLAASSESVELLVVSAFRSVDYQASIIQKKLLNGQLIEDILKTNTAPGHSEHHSGRALDLTALHCKVLSEEFEQTNAFRWLTENAHAFGFTLSYPRHNKWGMIYEPWHWCHDGS